MADLRTVAPPDRNKRLTVFLDGTTDKSEGNTNVWRARSLCAAKGDDGREQRIFYAPGVGTQLGEIARGQVFGYGIDDQVIGAYGWLVENYDEGDEIFVFGFSRGAFAARSLAGYVSRCGVIRPGSPLGVKQLYDRYKRGDDVLTIHELLETGRDQSGFKIEERWMLKDCVPAPVEFVGVWDSVGSLGNHVAMLTGGDHRFLDTNLRKSERHVYHAMAIDENRIDFDVTLYTWYRPNDTPGDYASPRPLADVEQRWFAGAHGDVGGGTYSDALAQLPLRWLLGKASLHGLTFKRDIEVDPEAATGAVEDSFADFLHGGYKVYSFGRRNWRTIGREPVPLMVTTVHTVNETIDKSVFERVQRDKLYRPDNLVDWAVRRHVDLTDIMTSVSVDDATAVPD